VDRPAGQRGGDGLGHAAGQPQPRGGAGAFDDQFASTGMATGLLTIGGRTTIVILSFRVSQGCDLRCPVVDSVADGTLAA
jgi:hypothetical protein